MRQRRPALSAWEKALRQPGRRPSWIGPLLFWFLVLFALFRASEWWEAQRASRAASRTLPSSRPPTAATPPAVPPAHALVPPLPVRQTPQSPSAPQAQSITKCVTRGGQASYSDASCPGGAQATTVRVQPNLNLADGMSPQAREAVAQSNRDAAEALRQQEQRQAAAAATSSHNSLRECEDLNNAIAYWDAMARHPLPGQTQDWIRQERKQARDRRFRLGCR